MELETKHEVDYRRLVLLGTEDACFGLPAEDPWMGVSATKTAENWAGEALRVQGLAGVWSDKV